jgi:hypothetical protein
MVINAQIMKSNVSEDFEFSMGKNFATVEVKMSSGTALSVWTVSGQTPDHGPRMLLQMQIGLATHNEVAQFAECKKLAKLVFTLSEHSALGGGLSAPTLMLETERRIRVALIHFQELDSRGLLTSSESLNVRTSRQHELCKSFGIAKSVEFLAEYEGVPLSTIQRRLAKARDAGLIAKRPDMNKRK